MRRSFGPGSILWLALLASCGGDDGVASADGSTGSTGLDDDDSSSAGTTTTTTTASSSGVDESTSSTTSTTSSSEDGDGSSSSSTGGGGSTLPPEAWTRGEAPPRVSGAELLDLPGALEGDPFWVSNNPERIFGAGWLFQHARADAERGGESLSLERFSAYLFHLNASGGALTVHLIATNPNPDPVTVSAEGSLYDNGQHPIGELTGPSVAVAADHLEGTGNVDVQALSIPPSGGVELARISVSAAAVLDGRVEVEASAGVFLYAVATADGSTDTAINLTQSSAASGEIVQPGPNEFGRMAGVYSHDSWRTELTAEIPPAPAHVGLALNTNDKFQLDGVTLQDQTAPALVRLSDSSEKSYGNYGMQYDLTLSLCAPDEPRTVGVVFGSNYTNDVDQPSFTWNGPVRVGSEIVGVYTRPTAPSTELAEVTVSAGACVELPIEFLVPGLITGGQQLVLESR